MQEIVMTDDQWVERYEPEEKMYETHGEDWGYISTMPAQFVWTLLDTDDEPVIVNGRSFVNRVGFYVSKKPHNVNDVIVVGGDE
jgi:hypothetical protein